MYKIVTRTKSAEKQYFEVFNSRDDIPEKIEKLKENPRGFLDAHKLKGKLAGLWSCWLGSDLRIVYEIDDKNKEIIVVSSGSHKKAYL